jgi:hypothetical protein
MVAVVRQSVPDCGPNRTPVPSPFCLSHLFSGWSHLWDGTQRGLPKKRVDMLDYLTIAQLYRVMDPYP